MGMDLEHPDPSTFNTDVESALDAFEQALEKRYKADLDDHLQVWTPHGEEPDPKPTASAGPAPDTVSIGYDRAKLSAPSWAAEARADVKIMVPVFDTQDLSKIESAFNDFNSAQKLLGGSSEVGDESTIADLVNKINGRSGKADEFANWAGVSGETFKNNFGQFVDPTMENQTAIGRSLANLYSGRACLVESARGNTLAAIERATKALGATVDSGAELGRWTAVSVGAIVVGLASAGVGTAISIVAVVGGFLDSQTPDQKYANDIEAVVTGLKDELLQVSLDVSSSESTWSDKVKKLQKAMAGAPKNELELFDFSGQGSGTSSPPAGGFDVDVDYVNKLATLCFEASDEYERVIKLATATDSADGELKGEYSIVTTGDSELIDTRNAFVSFLQTTCARYYEAGCRLNDAARTYYGNEAETEAIMKHIESRPDLNGDDRGKGGPVDDHVKGTDRGDIKDWPEPYPPYGPYPNQPR